jgi:hypothetical protein
MHISTGYQMTRYTVKFPVGFTLVPLSWKFCNSGMHFLTLSTEWIQIRWDISRGINGNPSSQWAARWHKGPMAYSHVYAWLQTRFWLVRGFFGLLELRVAITSTQSTIPYGTKLFFSNSCVFISPLVTSSNGRRSPSSGVPNCPRSTFTAILD